MRKAIRVPAIGPIGSSFDLSTQQSVAAIKEIVEVREGRRGDDFLDKAVTFRDLVQLGLIAESQVPRKP